MIRRMFLAHLPEATVQGIEVAAGPTYVSDPIFLGKLFPGALDLLAIGLSTYFIEC